ncbi:MULTISPECIES: DUF2628 domain-containing protein [Brevibacillus]|uniref:DUF2628 domain-containing protein n=1 Tax=Brevibacillus TaxID=55080 RepID=UPI000D10BA36|nr:MULTISPECIES: DUF2628 domain-containing protein [Brevibacillus]PSJ68241.1 DUF2628 domain-containing protein [Brevibacillus brevis]RED35753.1 uncharacterized protein DUF2628 [Brevibacillus brevis]TQK53436.1 uncharacterized protein DUF2628 [Brevibacillus sp. AG162]VEF89136.1 Protein of uncharacterised function (DUF2628) [Brevibacillus brevis]GEC89295.1 hypothetical protein BBR01nite_16260 [Brevibacillus brevis]
MDTQLTLNYLSAYVHHHKYYLDVWRTKGFSWNWGAAFFGEAWFAFRKMYLLAIIIYSVNLCVGLLLGLVGLDDATFYEIYIVFAITQRVLFALTANFLYYVSAVQTIKKAHSKHTTLDLDEIKKLGGTSVRAVIVVVLVNFCFSLLDRFLT